MKKLFVLAMVATLLTAGSAFAVQRHFGATPNATFQTFIGQGPATTNNDDSCDISVAPAATLLLPVFEVDMDGTHNRETTLFTVTNVSRFPQIAHVTIWTEYSVPVLDFNLFLTGYDVQGINLYDVLFNGIVANTSGTSSGSKSGSLSEDNDANPYISGAAFDLCDVLPGQLPTSVYQNAATALQTGAWSACGTGKTAGGSHAGLARGYVTVDVANNCSTSLPTDASYFPTEILFDNVLIGDYEVVGQGPVGQTVTSFDGAANPMVHIRAVPEGGSAGAVASSTPTNLPFTFYDRYTPTSYRRIDRRQPLPSTFAARFIQNTASGYSTNYKIWREGKIAADCTSATSLTGNAAIPIAEIVRFDEDENPSTAGGGTICSPCSGSTITLPEASVTATTNSIYPANNYGSSDQGGWMYLNLNNGGSTIYSTANAATGTQFDSTSASTTLMPGSSAKPTNVSLAGPRPSQNWVVITMFAGSGAARLSGDFDAAWLGNGCSMAAAPAGTGPGTIGPAVTYYYGLNTNGNGQLVCAYVDANNCSNGVNLGSNWTPLPMP